MKHDPNFKNQMVRAIALCMLIFFTACQGNKSDEKEEPQEEEPCPDTEVSLQQSEDFYAMQFLSMVNVLSEIRNGRAEELAANIESSMPTYLGQIAGFEKSTMRTVSLIAASRMYNKMDQDPPGQFVEHFEAASAKAGEVLSEDCYDLLSICQAAGCTPLPTSLRPVDVDSPNPAGWHYIVDSHCGFSWPKFWNLGCGPPLNGVACE